MTIFARKTSQCELIEKGFFGRIWRGFCRQFFLGGELLILTFAVLYFGQKYFDVPNHTQLIEFHWLLLVKADSL